MKKTLSAKGQKLLKVFHLLFNFMWIGGAFSMMLLLLEPTLKRVMNCI